VKKKTIDVISVELGCRPLKRVHCCGKEDDIRDSSSQRTDLWEH